MTGVFKIRMQRNILICIKFYTNPISRVVPQLKSQYPVNRKFAEISFLSLNCISLSSPPFLDLFLPVSKLLQCSIFTRYLHSTSKQFSSWRILQKYKHFSPFFLLLPIWFLVSFLSGCLVGFVFFTCGKTTFSRVFKWP